MLGSVAIEQYKTTHGHYSGKWSVYFITLFTKHRRFVAIKNCIKNSTTRWFRIHIFDLDCLGAGNTSKYLSGMLPDWREINSGKLFNAVVKRPLRNLLHSLK